MASIPTTQLTAADGRTVNVNTHEVDAWRAEGWRTPEEVAAAAEKVAADANLARALSAEELDPLKVEELTALAEARGVALKAGAKRKDIVEALLAPK